MSVRVILELHVKPEFTEGVRDGFKEQLVDTRAFEGCEEISVLQDQDDPNRLLVLGQWATRENFQAYLAWRTERGATDNLDEICTEPHKFSYFDYVRA